jgi:hypothetical protein
MGSFVNSETIFLFTEGQNTLMGKQQLGWWTRQAAKIWFSCQQWGEKDTFAVCKQVLVACSLCEHATRTPNVFVVKG